MNVVSTGRFGAHPIQAEPKPRFTRPQLPHGDSFDTYTTSSTQRSFASTRNIARHAALKQEGTRNSQQQQQQMWRLASAGGKTTLTKQKQSNINHQDQHVHKNQTYDRQGSAKRQKLEPAEVTHVPTAKPTSSAWYVAPLQTTHATAQGKKNSSTSPAKAAPASREDDEAFSSNGYMDDEVWDSSALEFQVQLQPGNRNQLSGPNNKAVPGSTSENRNHGHALDSDAVPGSTSGNRKQRHAQKNNKTPVSTPDDLSTDQHHAWGEESLTDWRKAMVKIRQGESEHEDSSAQTGFNLNRQASSSASSHTTNRSNSIKLGKKGLRGQRSASDSQRSSSNAAGSSSNTPLVPPTSQAAGRHIASQLNRVEPHHTVQDAVIQTDEVDGLLEDEEAELLSSTEQQDEREDTGVSKEEALVWDLYGDMLRKMQGQGDASSASDPSSHPAGITVSVLVGSESDSVQTLPRDSDAEAEPEVRPAMLTMLMKECSDWEELQEVVAAHGHRFNHIHAVMAVQRLSRLMHKEGDRQTAGQRQRWHKKGNSRGLTHRLSAAHSARPAVSARQGLYYALLVQRVFELLAQQLPAMGPRELSGTMFALGKLSKARLEGALVQADHNPPDDLVTQLLASSQPRLRRMSGIQLVNMLWGCAALKLQLQGPWLQAWFSAAQSHLQQLSSGDLSTAILSLANLHQTPPSPWFSQWQTSSQNTWRRDPQTPVRAISNSIWALATLQLQPTSAWLHGVLALWPVRVSQPGQQQQGGLRERGRVEPAPVDSAMLLWGVAKLGMEVDDAWLEGVLVDVEPQLQEFSPQDLANIIWALATLRHTPTASLSQTYLEVSYLTMDDFSLHELATMLWGLGKLDQQPPTRWQQSLLAVCHDMLQYNEGIQLDDVALLLAGLVHSRQVPSSWWLDQVWKSTEGLLQYGSTQELAMLCWTMGKMKVTPPVSWMRCCTSRLLQICPDLSPEQAGAILWSLGVVQSQHDPDNIDTLLRGVRPLLQRCDAVQLEKMAWGLFRLRHAPDSAWQSSFLEATQHHMPHMKACTLANIVTSAAALGMQPQDEWRAAVIARTLQVSSTFTFPQLRRLLYSFKRMTQPRKKQSSQDQPASTYQHGPHTTTSSTPAAEHTARIPADSQQTTGSVGEWHRSEQRSDSSEHQHMLGSRDSGRMDSSRGPDMEEEVDDTLWQQLAQGDAELIQAMADLQALEATSSAMFAEQEAEERATNHEGPSQDESASGTTSSPTFESLLQELRQTGSQAWDELMHGKSGSDSETEEDGNIKFRRKESMAQQAAMWDAKLTSLLDELSSLHPSRDSADLEEDINIFGNQHHQSRRDELSSLHSSKDGAGLDEYTDIFGNQPQPSRRDNNVGAGAATSSSRRTMTQEEEDIWAVVAAQFTELKVEESVTASQHTPPSTASMSNGLNSDTPKSTFYGNSHPDVLHRPRPNSSKSKVKPHEVIGMRPRNGVKPGIRDSRMLGRRHDTHEGNSHIELQDWSPQGQVPPKTMERLLLPEQTVKSGRWWHEWAEDDNHMQNTDNHDEEHEWEVITIKKADNGSSSGKARALR